MAHAEVGIGPSGGMKMVCNETFPYSKKGPINNNN